MFRDNCINRKVFSRTWSRVGVTSDEIMFQNWGRQLGKRGWRQWNGVLTVERGGRCQHDIDFGY